MKIAIPVNEDRKTICVSFGRTPEFLVRNTESGETTYVSNEAAATSGGAGIKAAQLIVDHGIEALLTPRCGENAANVLQAANVTLYQTTSQDMEGEIEKFKQGTLQILSNIHAGFHNHGFGK